jgi:hypothetical protein
MQGRKHGKGELTYEDGRIYIGEFANGFEHGKGRIKYPNNSIFEGRFRFGRRDGPGILKFVDGKSEKRNFRDTVVIPERPPPEVYDDIEEDNATHNNPKSLLSICLDTLANAMKSNPHRLPPTSRIKSKCPYYMKSVLGISYLNNLNNGSKDFKEYGPTIAYTDCDIIKLYNIRMNYDDITALIYFTDSNIDLKELHLVSAKLTISSFELFTRQLSRNIWNNLLILNLSYNRINIDIMEILCEAISNRNLILQTLQLAGCHITHNNIVFLSDLIGENIGLKELDLAFNVLEEKGAEFIAKALYKNTNLKKLNLRSNRISREGGMILASALQYNKTLSTLIIADNNIGEETTIIITARLNGSIKNIYESFCCGELEIPKLYHPDNYGIIRTSI